MFTSLGASVLTFLDGLYAGDLRAEWKRVMTEVSLSIAPRAARLSVENFVPLYQPMFGPDRITTMRGMLTCQLCHRAVRFSYRNGHARYWHQRKSDNVFFVRRKWWILQ